MINIRPLTTMDSGIDYLANIASIEGHTNIVRLRDEFLCKKNCFAKPGECLFGAYYGNKPGDSEFDSGALIGCGGLNIDPFSTGKNTGRIRRVYVAPDFRNRGTGEMLIRAIENAATGHFQILHINTNSPSAGRFYEHLGYHPVPLENATHVKRLCS